MFADNFLNQGDRRIPSNPCLWWCICKRNSNLHGCLKNSVLCHVFYPPNHALSAIVDCAQAALLCDNVSILVVFFTTSPSQDFICHGFISVCECIENHRRKGISRVNLCACMCPAVSDKINTSDLPSGQRVV